MKLLDAQLIATAAILTIAAVAHFITQNGRIPPSIQEQLEKIGYKPPTIEVGRNNQEWEIPTQAQIIQGDIPKFGQPILLNFWTSWSPESLKGLSETRSISKQAPPALQIVGISSEDKKSIENIKNRYKISYTLLLDTESQIHKKYFIDKVPTSILFDKQGKIIWRGNTQEIKLKEIENLLKRKS